MIQSAKLWDALHLWCHWSGHQLFRVHCQIGESSWGSKDRCAATFPWHLITAYNCVYTCLLLRHSEPIWTLCQAFEDPIGALLCRICSWLFKRHSNLAQPEQQMCWKRKTWSCWSFCCGQGFMTVYEFTRFCKVFGLFKITRKRPWFWTSFCHVLSISQPKLSHFLSGSWRVMFSSSSPVVRVSAFANVANQPLVLVDVGACAHILPRRKLQSCGIWVWLEHVRTYSNPFYPFPTCLSCFNF